MKFKLSTGVEIQEGNTPFDTINHLGTAILGEIVLKVSSEHRDDEENIKKLRTEIAKEIASVVSQIPLDELTSFMKALLFNDIANKYVKIIENINKEDKNKEGGQNENNG